MNVLDSMHMALGLVESKEGDTRPAAYMSKMQFSGQGSAIDS